MTFVSFRVTVLLISLVGVDSEWSGACNGADVAKEDVVESILTRDMTQKSGMKPYGEDVRRL